MDGVRQTSPIAAEERFAWHPTYQGRTVGEVRGELTTELERDQRGYKLAMEGAEEHEQHVLGTVIDLDRRWGAFDFAWHEVDATELADRVVAFEWAREGRRELFPFAEHRLASAPLDEASMSSSRPWWAFWKR